MRWTSFSTVFLIILYVNHILGMQKMYLNFLEGAIKHCGEHIQQHNHHDDVVNSIENIANILNELMVNVNDNWFHFWQAKNSPK